MTVRKPTTLSRRRALTVIAGGAAALWASNGAAALPGLSRRFVWRGTALGAEAEIILYHRERAAAEAAVRAAQAEIDRLEAEFSLFRGDSAVCRLNRDGRLDAPSMDMLRLLDESRRWSARSGGAFDISVQPLWRLYAEHFLRRTGAEDPPPAAVARALALVDYRKIAVAPDRVTLAPGMAVTFNGIAQGYITDRVADLLRDHGWTHVLVGLGEWRALGPRGDSAPWTVGIPAAAASGGPGTIPLIDGALATSAGSRLAFDATGRRQHLLSPATGASPAVYASITVQASRATTADALSTALYVAPPEAATALLSRVPGARAWLTLADGRTMQAG
ncbi:MAG: FAD:protein FMN transferase [Rhodospirillales bacterium]|nr:FAD:protein FMN transferase [Rhodospirillales bacterium]